jgi:hypothetical protein
MIPLPTISIDALVDDMEDADRTSIGTLRVYRSDFDHDHSRAMFTKVARTAGNASLILMARMAEKERPFIRLDLPLSMGGLEPVDVSRFTGVQFEARGDGGYFLILESRHVRDSAEFRAPFEAGGSWKTIQIPFSALRQTTTPEPQKWTGKDLQLLTFEVSRDPGAQVWLDLDNVRFYR